MLIHNGHHMRIFLIATVLPLIISCSKPGAKNEKKETIKTTEHKLSSDSESLLKFSRIDNRVTVYADDVLVYDSETVHSNPELDIQVNITSALAQEPDSLKVTVYNGEPPYTMMEDPEWEIHYELIINGEEIDFVFEHAENNALGMVFSKRYSVNDWSFKEEVF